MFDKVDQINKELQSAHATNPQELEAFRMRFISRKSLISALFDDLKAIPNEQKKAFGEALNQLKTAANEKFKSLL